MKKLDYKTILKYLVTFFTFFLCFRAINGAPLGIAALHAFLCEGFCFFTVFAVFVFAALTSFSLAQAVALTVAGVILCLIYYVYKKRKATAGFEQFVYIAIALTAYVFGPFSGDLTAKLTYCLITALFCLAFQSAVKSVFFKKFRKKSTGAELACLSAATVILSLGFINVCSVEIWNGVCIFLLLAFCYYYKSPRAFIPAVVLPLSTVLHTFSLNPLALSVIYCSVTLLFIKKSRLLATLALMSVQFLRVALFETADIGIENYFYAFVPSAAFLFFPAKLQNAIKSRLTAFDEKQILKEIINDERGELSSKLYGVSDVFAKLERDVIDVDGLVIAGEDLIEKMVDEIILEVCNGCPRQSECLNLRRPVRDDLFKLVRVGIGKGKVSLIDLSKDFSSYCFSTNGVMYEANKLLAEFQTRKERLQTVEREKRLLAVQSGGVSEVLKNLAFNYSEKLRFKECDEEKIFQALCLSGIVPEQTLCLGNKELHLLFSDGFDDFKRASEVISQVMGEDFCLVRKTDLGRGLLCVFKKAPLFDAAFGVAKRTKDGSSQSGDTYSLSKISEGKFLVALCDGMGSGKRAGEGSASAVSLVESLSRAGLSGGAVARLSNSMLSLCDEESFSALDMVLVDLYGGNCDMLKIGAPFGALISDEGVMVIDGSSLPLGILDDVSPQTSAFNFKGGEMLVLMSDGITDAFFSSTDTVEFLQGEKCKNPQTLAEKLLERALNNCNGEAKDDMTALVMKIYKRA